MIKYESFYTFEEMQSLLRSLSSEHEQFVQLKSLTDTKGGRKVYLVEVTDPVTGPAESKGAYYVQAGLHAIEGAGVTAALHVLYSLLTEDKFSELLKQVAFYIVPCVDPDGMDCAVNKQIRIRSRYDSLHRKNELIPQDINEDGYILQMRWQDPTGPFKEHPKDSRLMVRREVGDIEGPFYQVFQEGEIRDHDGTPPNLMRRIDFNRSYPTDWHPNLDTTAYPFSQPEMRAIGDFTVSHPNIFAGVDFHCGTYGILRFDGKSDQDLHPADLNTTLQVGKMAEEITGFPLMKPGQYGYGPIQVRMFASSTDWAYSKLGISHFIVEVGYGFTSIGLEPEEILHSDARDQEEFTRRLLTFHDERDSEIFMPWKPYNHPQLGEIEIGGMMAGNAMYMYPSDMKETVPQTTKFVMKHAAMGPRLVIANVETAHLGEDLYRIRAAIGNIGGLSTDVMKDGGSIDMKRPVSVRLSGKNMEILNRSNIYESDTLDALGGSFATEWFVRVKEFSNIIIEAFHPRAGRTTKQVSIHS